MEKFKSQNVLNIFLGSKHILAYPENDYLRVLWDNGIIGFLIFISLLACTFYFLVNRYSLMGNSLVLAGIIVFIMYLINSLGSYPMLNPAFQWFVWGIIAIQFPRKKMTKV